ncbi:MAG: VWA domain-containing protein [Pseudomonadota bacterium]
MFWRRKKQNGEATEVATKPSGAPDNLTAAPTAADIAARIAETTPAAPDTPGQSEPVTPPAGATSAADFIAQMKSMTPRTDGERGRLIFAMDATMSRQPTWDMALALQSEMFSAVKDVGGLDVQLMYFRGSGECRASKWVRDPDALARLMTTVTVAGGWTQIRKVLTHARKETQTKRVHALVYVGDSVEEDVDDLCGRAGELSVLGVPVFLFQEGRDANAARAFAEIARITKGAHCQFNAGSADQLKALLAAVAVYAAGGRAALENMSARGENGAQLLLTQMK